MKTAASSCDRLSPPLKWAGGKRWLIPTLLQLWQPYSQLRLVEPFVGGMAVALGLQPQQAILNDCNFHLINFYRRLQKGLRIDIPLDNKSEYYYQCRARFNALVLAEQANSLEAAQLFYFMNRTGYNGLCRFSSRNQFNVPFGRYKNINYIRDFTHYVPVLKNWLFTKLPTMLVVTLPRFGKNTSGGLTKQLLEIIVVMLLSFSCSLPDPPRNRS